MAPSSYTFSEKNSGCCVHSMNHQQFVKPSLSQHFFLPTGLQMTLFFYIYVSLKYLHKIHVPPNTCLPFPEFTVCLLYDFSLLYVLPLISWLFLISSEECLYTSLCYLSYFWFRLITKWKQKVWNIDKLLNPLHFLIFTIAQWVADITESSVKFFSSYESTT